VAQNSWVPRRSPKAGSGERPPRAFLRRSVFPEDVDVAARRFVCLGKRYVDQTTDVLDAERRVTRRQRAVGKRIDEVKAAVVYLDHVLGKVGGIKKISRGPVGNRETGVARASRPSYSPR